MLATVLCQASSQKGPYILNSSVVLYFVRANARPTVSCCEGEFSALGQEKSGQKLGYLILKG
jgi:hypothetical protein